VKRWTKLLALTVVLGVLAVPVGASTASATSGVEGPRPVSAKQMQRWVKKLVSFGIRRPGYPADNKAARWIEDQFEAAGLKNVHRDPVRVNRWTPKKCSVTWWADASPAKKTKVDCFALPYSKPKVDLTAAAIPDDGSNDIAGKVGVVNDHFQEIPQGVIAEQALQVVAPQEWVDTDLQPIPFGVRNGDLFADFFGPTESRGGVGFIGILDGLGTDRYYAPYTGENVDLPAVWIGQRAGERLSAAMAAGPTQTRIRVTAERKEVPSSNVVGELPADADKWVMVGSHHDAPWASAVEDASGVAQVLAQAHHWAKVPKAERPQKMMFVATAGHMDGAAGSIALLQDYPEILDDTVLEVHLEHVAKRAHMEDGKLRTTDDPETRWWFVTRRPDLQQIVAGSLEDHGMDRDLILPAVGFFGGTAPLSDAAPLSLAGVPIISLITTPIYLFDPRDTPDKVDTATMEVVSEAATQMIDASRDLTQTRKG
jgi:hypothetical protein